MLVLSLLAMGQDPDPSDSTALAERAALERHLKEMETQVVSLQHERIGIEQECETTLRLIAVNQSNARKVAATTRSVNHDEMLVYLMYSEALISHAEKLGERLDRNWNDLSAALGAFGSMGVMYLGPILEYSSGLYSMQYDRIYGVLPDDTRLLPCRAALRE